MGHTEHSARASLQLAGTERGHATTDVGAVQSSAYVVRLIMVASSRCRRRGGRVISRESGYSSPKQTEASINGHKLTPTRHGTARHGTARHGTITLPN
jgi:hypothetical protein